jgi:hypothetical protein
MIRESGHIYVRSGATIGQLMLDLQDMPQDAVFGEDNTIYCHR